MPAKNRKVRQFIVPVELGDLLEEKLVVDHPADAARPKMSTYIQSLLWTVVENDKILRAYAPYLGLIPETEGDSVYLKDWKLGKVVEIRVRDNKLWCDEDETFGCAHVGFVWAQPELYRRLIDKGLHPVDRKGQ